VTWRAIARSAIGTSHQKQQLPCQDYAGDRVLGDLVLGAVADGAGSARHAEIGAELAVNTALQYLVMSEKLLQQKWQSSWQSLKQPPSPEKIRRLFTKLVDRVLSVLNQRATQDGCVVSDLASTLLVFLATPRWIAAMQIGDGFIVARSQQGDYRLLFQPDKGEYANQTTFVTSATALKEMQLTVLTGHHPFICAASDGLERVAIRLQDWTPFPPFFHPLEEYLQETEQPEQDDAYLMAFLESERLSQRTDDDKTLLLCLYG
jgi:serine/threonine protein phosphatase PrpC